MGRDLLSACMVLYNVIGFEGFLAFDSPSSEAAADKYRVKEYDS